MDSCPIAVIPRSSTRNLTTSSDQPGNGVRLNFSGSFSNSLDMSVLSEAAARHAAGLLLPGAEILERKSLARVGGEIGRRVENHERQNHLLERDFVHRNPVLRKMRGRIDMGAILTGHFVISL